ncbi:MAG: hypothetical protein EZS28_031581 [Streblomastix strix]|uniref:Uncharacterized protein n=1 Tax=Streblomastix strix TaxID=222440 RepID=A0A5J4US59_9EUKA|nr:MAG: hypothetical protein EZS28_031581 [Streblomastix strix]
MNRWTRSLKDNIIIGISRSFVKTMKVHRIDMIAEYATHESLWNCCGSNWDERKVTYLGCGHPDSVTLLT